MYAVYSDSNLTKQIDALRKAGGQPALVADHADSIIRELAACGNRGPEHAGRMTRNGEARIKECVKYDLVHGYRLIGFKEVDGLTFSFVGTHDACDRWIRGCQRKRPVRKRKEKLDFSAAIPDDLSPEESHSVVCDFEDDPLGRIDEIDLRKIFHGLAHE